jgi:phosphate transport system substrate-binding protein
MAEFAHDKLLPSCVHGEAAPAAFQQAFNDAVSSFIVERNVENFAKALVLAAQKAGPETVGMVDFVGQAIGVENSQIPGAAPGQYAKEVNGARKLSLNLRFPRRSNQLDDKSLADLDRLVELLASPEYQQRQVLLFGFSDSAGSAKTNLAISKRRAKVVAEQLWMRGITPSLVDGYGKDLPIAPNDTEEGREKNRRVEIWLR